MAIATRKRRALVAVWRVMNPVARPVAGVAPWWVLVETTGNRTGRTRRTPLASGPRDGDAMLLIAVHGHRSSWVRNIERTPAVRVKHRGRWCSGTASVHELDPAVLRRFNRYARSGPMLAGIDPVLVRVEFDEDIAGT